MSPAAYGALVAGSFLLAVLLFGFVACRAPGWARQARRRAAVRRRRRRRAAALKAAARRWGTPPDRIIQP